MEPIAEKHYVERRIFRESRKAQIDSLTFEDFKDDASPDLQRDNLEPREPPKIFVESFKVYCNSDLWGDVVEALEKNQSITNLVVGKNEKVPEDQAQRGFSALERIAKNKPLKNFGFIGNDEADYWTNILKSLKDNTLLEGLNLVIMEQEDLCAPLKEMLAENKSIKNFHLA